MKPKLIVGFAVTLSCAVAAVVIVKLYRADMKAFERAIDPARQPAPPGVKPAAHEPLPQTPVVASTNAPQTPPKEANVRTETRPPAAVPAVPSQSPNPIIYDPAVKAQLGRIALSYVGADPAADEFWAWTINDPNLPANTRQDLIEDLNENGFSDGDGSRATVDDLPLIENRILLIEQLAPGAMDEVNAAAFMEAYKDLVNMWVRLTRS